MVSLEGSKADEVETEDEPKESGSGVATFDFGTKCRLRSLEGDKIAEAEEDETARGFVLFIGVLRNWACISSIMAMHTERLICICARVSRIGATFHESLEEGIMFFSEKQL